MLGSLFDVGLQRAEHLDRVQLAGVCDFSVAQLSGRLVNAARASSSHAALPARAAGGAAQQGLAGGMRVGDAAEGEARAGLARRAFHQRAFRIDRDEAAGRF